MLVYASFVASPILQVAYTESLAMLLLVGFLLALARERWLVASVLALGLGVTRPIAVPLGLVALVAVVLRWRRRSGERLPRGELLSMGAVLAACGVAGLAWPAIAWWVTGVRSAYTDTMATWRSTGEVTPVRPWLDIARYLGGDTLGPTGLAVLVVALVLMVLGPWASCTGPQRRAWCLAYPAYLAVVLDPWTSIFRYLLPLFPLGVVLVGGGWSRRPPHRASLADRPARRRRRLLLPVSAGLGAVPVRAAVGLPAVTDLRAAAPVRALRDRLLTWPTWAVLLGFYLLTRAPGRRRHPGGGRCAARTRPASAPSTPATST